MDHEIIYTVHQRHEYDQLRGVEHAKNKFVETLLEQLEALNQAHQQEKLDHAREAHFNREVQRREMKLQEDLRMLKAKVERDAFILVLIDGDGMIFEDRFIEKGEEGGKEAASILWGAIREYVHSKVPDLSSDCKVVTRIYANLKGLGDVCNRAGILSNPILMEDFARGFTGSKQLFDFVDVGSGKDRADDKISELFKLYLYNCHCRHILFGCSHDNGYARLLEEVADQTTPGHITLLEGVPFERELALLRAKYETTKFDGLFRTSKINVYPQQFSSPSVARVPSTPQTQPLSQPLPEQMHYNHQTQVASAPPQPQAQQMHYQSPYQPIMTRTPSTSTNNSTMINPAISSWASKALSAPPAQIASPPPTPTPAPAENGLGIPRNKYGQRVDPAMQYDKNEVKRVSKIKMCNVHFLRHDCPYGDECSHDHTYKPNKNELLTLKYVARQTPCHFGTQCDDIKCIYGHRCPASIEGSRDCHFADRCRFNRNMHGIDMKVVRTTKVS